jgi:hypothetical protein
MLEMAKQARRSRFAKNRPVRVIRVIGRSSMICVLELANEQLDCGQGEKIGR